MCKWDFLNGVRPVIMSHTKGGDHVEILGNNLQKFFEGTDAKLTYDSEQYQVWEISDKLLEEITNMDDLEFQEKYEDGWWRWSDGSILNEPFEKIKINNRPIVAWGNEYCMRNEKNKSYSKLTEYYCDFLGASLPKNVCALSVDLAKHNNMKMSELFMRYENAVQNDNNA